MNDKSTSNDNKDSDNTSETKKEQGHTSISALAGAQISNPLTGQAGTVYGAHIQRDILGPVSIGLWGLSNATVGGSVGISF